MAIKFEKIKAGMKLLDVHKHQMGNTHMRRLGWWPVEIISVDEAAQTAIVSWNNNPAQTWDKRRLERLYTKKPPKLLEQEEQERARRY